jgi:glucose/arabinose dehydrogenase
MIRKPLIGLILIALAVPALLAASPVAPVVAATVPAGFTDVSIANIGVSTTIGSFPDGRAVALEKSGRMRIIANGAMLPAPAISLSVCDSGEMGLLGFAADPDFGRNAQIYLYYTASIGNCGSGLGRVNRVSRFTMSGNLVVPGSEVVLVDNISALNSNHNGGDIEIGNDGFLYVAIGDAGCNPRSPGQCGGSNAAAQDLGLLNGKILRVDRFTGAGAPGNPLRALGAVPCRTRGNTPATPATWCEEIYAWGLRNPFRFAFDTNTGATRFFINDVGQNRREEINEGQLGANYGWPAREGRCAQSWNGTAATCPPPTADADQATVATCRPSGTNICVQPIDDYSHNEAHADFIGEYITGGSFVPNGAWPAEYDGGYMFTDGSPGTINFRDRNGDINFAAPFGTDASVYDLNFVLEPTGWALYYIQNGGNIRKITYNNTAATPPGPMAYTPLAAAQRAYDSRNAGAASGPIRGGTTRLIDVNPPSSNVRAVLANVTLVRPRGTTYVSAWTPRTPRPFHATVNSPDAGVVANAAVLPVTADGEVVIMTSNTADVVVDVIGFYTTGATTATAGRYVPLTSALVMDSRFPPTAPNNVYTRSGSVLTVPIDGKFGVSNSSAVILSIIAVNSSPSNSGWLVAYPSGTAQPPTASANAVAGDERMNTVVVPLGANGAIDIFLSGGVTDAEVVVIGMFSNSTAPASTSGLMQLVTATREVDTRVSNPFGRLAANAVVQENPGIVPDGALASIQNVTTVNTGGGGAMTTFGGPAVPLVPHSISSGPFQTRGVLVMTPQAAGIVRYRVTMDTDLVADVIGYYTA